MATIGTIQVSVSANTQKFVSGLADSRRQLASFASGVTSAGLALAGLDSARGVADAARSIVEGSLEVEKAMVGLRKAADLDPKGLAGLKGELQGLSTTLAGVKLDNLYAIATTGAKMGVARGDLVEYTKGVSMVAMAMDDIPAAEIADSIGKLNVIFDLGVKGSQQLGSAIDKLADSGVSSASGILDVTQRISGTAAAAKISAAETTALAAALLDTGTRAELGATTLQRLIMGLNDVGAHQGFADALGISAERFGKMVEASPIKAIQSFLGALNKLDAASQQTVIGKIGIEGAQAAGEIQKLAKQADTVGRYVGLANVEFATLAQLNQSVALESERSGAALQVAQNHIAIISDTIGTQMLPAVREMAGAFNALATSTENSGNAFRGLVDGMLSAVPGFQLMTHVGRVKAMQAEALKAPAGGAGASAHKAAAVKSAAGSLAPPVDPARWSAAGDAVKAMGDRARAAYESIVTPGEKLKTQLGELNNLWAVGALDSSTFVRAMAKAREEFDKDSGALKHRNDMMEAAAKLKAETASPLETFKAEFAKAEELHTGGLISDADLQKKAALLHREFGEGMASAVPDRRLGGAMELGSAETRSTIINARLGADGDVAKQALGLHKQEVEQGKQAIALLSRLANQGDAAPAQVFVF